MTGVFETVGGERFVEALRRQPLPASAVAALEAPADVRRFRLPVDGGAGPRLLTAWRVRYCDVLGPTKGGVRFHHAVSEADLTALGFRLLLKCAVNALPHGGAGGGVAVDPRTLSAAEHEQVARRYVDALGDSLRADRDILSPDLGTDAQTMRWMADQCNRRSGSAVAGAINGKPLAIGGIPGRPGATARGAWTVLREVFARLGIEPRGLTFAVQGYGSAGGRLATLLQSEGLRLVGAADASGGLFDAAGLDADALWAAKAGGERLGRRDPGSARAIGSSEVLAVPADVIVPAATANQITADVAARLQCSMVVEIANSPIAPDAEAILRQRGIVVVPDIVVNAGGITMSHFEWAQNRGGLLWSEEDARVRLESRMAATARRMIAVADERDVSITTAAQIMAIERLSAAFG